MMEKVFGVLDIIYPTRCVFCHELQPKDGGAVCGECIKELPWTYNRCRVQGDHFKLCVAPLAYRDNAAKALLRFKFGGRTSYARCFAGLMARCLRENTDMGFTMITWVPLGPIRYIKRGYSQTKLLARELSRELKLPCVRLLTKRRDTPKQSGLRGEAARRANVTGAFRALRVDELKNQSILVVDDVVTTGATLSECARTLKAAGASQVYAAALCTAKRTKV